MSDELPPIGETVRTATFEGEVIDTVNDGMFGYFVCGNHNPAGPMVKLRNAEGVVGWCGLAEIIP